MQVVGGGGDRVLGVVDVVRAVVVAVDARSAARWRAGRRVMLNCIGPAQQPWRLTPERTPGAVERPWSVSIAPIAASTGQGTP